MRASECGSLTVGLVKMRNLQIVNVISIMPRPWHLWLNHVSEWLRAQN
jgi:hypothetical protein